MLTTTAPETANDVFGFRFAEPGAEPHTWVMTATLVAARRELRERSRVAHRSHTARTSVFARAFGNQRPRARHQLVVHSEERFAEPDPAGVVVVDK